MTRFHIKHNSWPIRSLSREQVASAALLFLLTKIQISVNVGSSSQLPLSGRRVNKWDNHKYNLDFFAI